ncbi:hypothetical protein HGP16_25295 [Rhizobium sp. P40RR-XXII]|uniref:recombination protein NinB n=1 Tax=Rhizobium sp. P40RR-XXII TaxID=2726739 RepID=UPI00145672AA|nr:recombination protein NinB [Rhizobium sp. P40RR-XXII]NLS19858.1 hypothetical protein [Rhizobium sp. P40RR-XXII]
MTTRQTVTIQGPEDRQKIATWARNVEAGTVVTFRKKSRSSEQSAKMWAMLGEVSDQVEWYGQKLDAEDWKDVFTASLRHARVVPGIDKGTYVPLGMHTSTLTIEEMSNLIELIYAFGAEHNVIFKEPKEQSDSGSTPSEPDTADSGALSASAASDDPPPTSSDAPLSQVDMDWLATVARMLWSATHWTGNADENLALLNNQRIACNALDASPSQAAREKAGSIYRVCKDAVLSNIYPPDALELVATHAGCTEKQITEIGASHD